MLREQVATMKNYAAALQAVFWKRHQENIRDCVQPVREKEKEKRKALT